MLLSHKAFNALNNSINNKFSYIDHVCANCEHLEDKIKKNNEFRLKNENKNVSNQYQNLIFSYDFIHFDTIDSPFDSTNSFFCPRCFSILYENVYVSLSKETIYSYYFSRFSKLKDEDKQFSHLAISNYFFPAFFIPSLEDKVNFVYSVDHVNFNIPLSSDNLTEPLLEFSKINYFDNIFLDFDDIPISNLLFNDGKTIVRFSINEQDLIFNKNQNNHNGFSSIGNYSFQILKNDVIAVHFYDFLWEQWIHVSDSEKLKHLINNNSLFFEKNLTEVPQPTLSLEALAKKMIKHFYHNEK